MTKTQYLADLKVGDYVDTIVVVKNKRRIPYRNRPGYYLSFILKDRTGAVDARVWDDTERIDREISERDVVRVRGIVELYQQLPQVRIASIEKVPEGEYNWSDLIPRTEKDVELLWEKITSAVESVHNPHLKSLLQSFFEDPEFVKAFKNAPASLYLHHSWVGGLIEHICSVLDLAEAVCRNYPELDRDLLITGVLLHDIGKVREYSWQVDIDRTDEGRLLGHLILGDEMVTEKIKQIPEFPSELAMRVRHMLISHHGVGEWGSPRPPMTLEAAALHFIEFVDAQLRKFATVLKERREPESPWTSYERTLGRKLFFGYQTYEISEEPEETENEKVTSISDSENLPSFSELPDITIGFELMSNELEDLTTGLTESLELSDLPEITEISSLKEIEEEPQKKKRQRKVETSEEGKLPL
ncbi:MAG: HD domain-containing protein [Armatimonadota bacterium]|nr:HD domain-containing protein [Armatimonadota bacterium]